MQQEDIQKKPDEKFVPPAQWRPYVAKAIIPVILIFLYYLYFYIPVPERQFLNAAHDAFVNGHEEVKISELTNFDWDRVCNVIGGKENTSEADLEEYTSADWSTSYNSLPGCFEASDCFFPAHLGLAFIEGNKIIRILVFNHSPNVWIGNAEYRIVDFLDVHLQKDAYKYCRSKEQAYLVRTEAKSPGAQPTLSIETK